MRSSGSGSWSWHGNESCGGSKNRSKSVAAGAVEGEVHEACDLEGGVGRCKVER